MDWKQYIHADPEILTGKPVVKGTRLSVEFILSLFANGWDQEQIFDNYPGLNEESIKAVFAFASDRIKEEFLYSYKTKS